MSGMSDNREPSGVGAESRSAVWPRGVPPAAVLGLVLGLVIGGVVALTGRVALGAVMAGIMLAYGIVLTVFRRIEPIALLGEMSSDERRLAIQHRAGYVALEILALFVIVGGVVDLARGGDGRPWTLIAFVAGASFVVGLVVSSRRS